MSWGTQLDKRKPNFLSLPSSSQTFSSACETLRISLRFQSRTWYYRTSGQILLAEDCGVNGLYSVFSLMFENFQYTIPQFRVLQKWRELPT